MKKLNGEDIVQNIFNATKKSDASMKQILQIRQKIKEKYKPRNRFNRWRDSTEGKIWKQQQYLTQKGTCAICQTTIDLKGSHIDHKLPIVSHPQLALESKNLHITCAACNCAKGTSSIE
jgi:5-methylcytosine-specific restriction endonuclease McrA